MIDRSDTDLEKAITGWLTTKGYPLEMKASRSFIRGQIGVRHGWYYDDPETGKPRELDLLASATLFETNALLFQAIVECKRSRDPFIAFTYGVTLAKTMHHSWVPSNPLGRSFLTGLTTTGIADNLPLYQPSSPIAYSLAQAHVSSEKQHRDFPDAAFEGLMTVTKASYSLSMLYTEKVTTIQASPDPRDYRPLAYIGVPLLITDAPIFTCHLDGEEQLALQRTHEISVEWSFPQVGTLMIKVISDTVLDSFVTRFSDTFRLLSGDARTLLSSLGPPPASFIRRPT